MEQTTATLNASEANNVKQAPWVEGVIPVILERWSPRSFAEREVSPELLAKVFEAARWAASSSNEQPWRFLVGRRGSETYNKIFTSLAEGNQRWARKAPVLILGATATRFARNGTENRVAMYDLGAAASYLTLQAAALGLATHQMGGFNTEVARKAFGIPEDYALGAVIALGYQSHPAELGEERLISMETSARTRKPLREFVYSSWGEPAEL
jgi:nitroreductase